jgi:hypothetical protein
MRGPIGQNENSCKTSKTFEKTLKMHFENPKEDFFKKKVFQNVKKF